MQRLESWRTLARRTVFSGGPLTEVAVETVRLPDGRDIDDYYVVRMPDYVLVFAEMADGTIPMFREYRHGPRRVCLTFPGGTIDGDESALEAARRELLEELGCVADSWQSLGHFVTNANQGCNTAHFFRATRCVAVQEPASGDLEVSEVVYWTRPTLMQPERLQEIGLTSHVALLLLATREADGQ